MNRNVFTLTLFLSLSILVSEVLASTFVQPYATLVVQPNSNVTISGAVYNTTNTSQGILGVNVSASITTIDNGSYVTGSSGTFDFNVTAPPTVGSYYVNITTNETAHDKSIPIYVSNMTGGSVTYTDRLPPYTAGTTFTVNITLLNDSTNLVNYVPDVRVFLTNGQETTWTVTNLTASSDANGVIRYNITIPATASAGQYAIVVDKGVLVSVFAVKSGYTVTVVTHDPGSEDEISGNFAPGSSVMILSKIKTSGGVAVTSGISSVTAYVTLPNGTVRSLSLQARNQTSYPGFYNNSFSETSVSGSYEVRVDAVVSGETVQAFTLFNTKNFNVRLETMKDFFMEWGGSAAFAAGQTVGLDIVALNLSTDAIMKVPTDIPACNSSYLSLSDVWIAQNRTSINSSVNNLITDGEFTTGQYMMNQICRIQFTGPDESGIYGVKVNVTLGSVSEVGEGYFSIQKFMLKATPVSGFGGEMGFMKEVSPGENATFSLSAYNLTSGNDLSGSLIQDVSVTKIVPIEFAVGTSEITTINYSVSYGTSPSVTVTIPDTVLGPLLIEIRANISNEFITGNAFLVANYLMGFMEPPRGNIPGPPSSSCSGTVAFSGTIFETKSMSAVSQGSVVINELYEAREEFTGKDVRSYITLSSNGTSDANGIVSVNMTFSQEYSFSGFYMLIFNASYQGKTAGIPAGVFCKNLNFWPEIRAVGGAEQSWRIAPSSPVMITITNITRLNDSIPIGNATVSLPMIMNFNMGKGGMKMLTPTSSFTNEKIWLEFNRTEQRNNVTFTIYPANFTTDGSTALSVWPNGFIDLQPTVCTEDLSTSGYPWSDGCDTGFGGFQVVPFDVWVEGFGWGQPLSVNTSLSYILHAKTNVSRIDYDAVGYYTGTNNTGFTVKIGRPWEGVLASAENVSAELIEDKWSSTGDMGTEKWSLNFTIPATTKKGEAMILITVNNSNGETTDQELWTTFTKYSVSLPYNEGLEEWWDFDATDVNEAASRGWNMTVVNQSLGIWSKSGRVCNKTGLISQRYGAGGSKTPLTYNPNLKLLIVDNTSGVYDTIVMNNSGQLSYVNDGNRTLSLNAYGEQGVYLRSVEGCHYAKVFNATDLPTGADVTNWGGESQTNKLLTIPYIVTLGTTPVPNLDVTVNGIAKQNDQGFGFEERLTGQEGSDVAASQNYSYVKGTTDSLGVGFLKVNVSNSGRFNLFWKVNSSVDEDIATFASGTSIEFRAFKSYGGPTYPLPKGRVVLEYTALPFWDVYGTGYLYNGTVAETSANDFVRDVNVSTWYIVYNATSNHTRIDDDANFTDDDSGNYQQRTFYWNSTVNINGGPNLAVSGYKTNTTPDGTMTLTFYQQWTRPDSIPSLTSGEENTTVFACAKTYDVPENKPIENATIKLYAMNWETWPATKTWLTLYNPMDDSIAAQGGSSEPTSTLGTGPFGCVEFKAYYEGGWPLGCTEVQGTATSGSNKENLWVGFVCR